MYHREALSYGISPGLLFLFCIYLSTTQFTIFLPPPPPLLSLCSIRWFPLFLSCTCWKILHSWNIFLQSSTDDYTSPSLLSPASPLQGGTMLLRLIIAHILPYTNPILQFTAFSFAFLTNEDGTDMFSWNVSKELPLLAVLLPRKTKFSKLLIHSLFNNTVTAQTIQH